MQDYYEAIIKAVNNLNKISWIDILQIIIVVISTIFTIWFSILTYKLQKKVAENDKKYKDQENSIHASNVYYFLVDVVYKSIDFKANEFNNISIDGKDFMRDINYLHYDVLTHEEFLLLREIFMLYDRIKNSNKNMADFKLIYKKVVDCYVNPEAIKGLREDNKIDDICSIKVLAILKKLEYEMKRKVCSTNTIHTIFDDEMCFVEKIYENKKHVQICNGKIDGDVEQYDIVIFDSLKIVFEKIYDGKIENGKYSGSGKYYYYTTHKDFGYKIDSCMLNQKNINYDPVSQQIKEVLEKNINDVNCYCEFAGKFKDGSIKSGRLDYKINKDDDFNSIKI